MSGIKSKHSKAGIVLKLTLLTGLSASLIGCATKLTPSRPKPTIPEITVIEREDGGICFNREDTEKLGNYIIELERE